MRIRFQTKRQPFLAFMVLSALAGSLPVLAWSAHEASWSGVVTYVVDGDTVRVRPPAGGKPVSIRIEGIDAPEICQSGGTNARDALSRQILNRQVEVHSKAHDDYGRTVARIVLKGKDQGKWMVENGLAWSNRYRKNQGPYAAQQRQAEQAGLGMFSPIHAAAPVYPGKFRKQYGRCYF